MLTLGNVENTKKPIRKYNCDICDFSSSHLGDWNKHLITPKHQKRQFAVGHPHKCACGKYFTRKDSLHRHKKICNYEESSIHKTPEIPKSLPKVSHTNECICGKTYKHASSLSKHKKTCLHITKTINEPKNNNSEVLEILGSLKQYNEKINAKLDKTCEDNQILKQDNQILKEDNKILKEKLSQLESGVMTAVSEPKTVNNNYNNIIFLLNEKCGDAVAIKDFAKQIAICLEDVDYAMENGKVKGIENIIRKKFEELGTFKRPLHCTDVKRGILYVKNEEGWEKERGEINKMIRDVECAQTKGITVWSDANPEYSEGNTRLMDKWLKIVKCLTDSIDGIGMRKIEKRCQEMSKIAKMQWCDRLCCYFIKRIFWYFFW
jgi:hypothetical protein